ncbi:MAG: shikimate dehydrogenase [Ornithinimicrobium sp.]|uniref:shikimate dehydrogenase n=1 Tax=Ornithinimicrobium sp. TaxID=1977084 RepID=UPI003D9BB9D3
MSPSSSSGAGTTPTGAETKAPVHAGVIGSPIAHSLSPTLHRAAYAALGLTGWQYHREEVRSGELTAYLAARPPDWVGLSVTMPGKEEALAAADAVSDVAGLTGAANTLVRTDAGWAGDNTDVQGIRRAFTEAGVLPGQASRGLVFGSGATARSALVALRGLGVSDVQLVVRDQARPATLELARPLGLRVRVVRLDDPLRPGSADLAISTVPALDPDSAGPVPPAWRGAQGCAATLDVVYRPWPTPFAREVAASGTRVIGGLEMLVHQAAAQVELMTGCVAPVTAMRAGLKGLSAEPVP